MANIFTYTFFIIGLFLIIKGGDIFVDSATQAAKMLKIPNFIIGATIVSIATTLPEIIVSSSGNRNQKRRYGSRQCNRLGHGKHCTDIRTFHNLYAL